MQLLSIVLLTSIAALSPPSIRVIEQHYDSTDALKTCRFRCAFPIKCPSSTSSNDFNSNGPPSSLQSLPVAAPFTDDSSLSDRVSRDSEAYEYMCRRFPLFQAKFHLILKPSQSIHPPTTKPTPSAASIFFLSLNMKGVNTNAARCGEHEPWITVHFNDSRQPYPIPRFTRFTDRFEVSFALYFPNSTNQAQFIRDMYSYDHDQFYFLPATTHFKTDPDFSFSALCTLSLDSLIMFNNQNISNAIQSDLDNDPITYSIIPTSSILICYNRRGEFVCVSGFCDHSYKPFQLRSFQFRHSDIVFRVQIGRTVSYTPSHCAISMQTSSSISGFRLIPATRFHFTLKARPSTDLMSYPIPCKKLESKISTDPVSYLIPCNKLEFSIDLLVR